ncbi:ketoacyl-ACP synthase III family protein [Streptomyces sp. OF3]|uniref:Ketoacyl-ACP synthase III family protein n=1 Tax=Streptomyces alkaliterrae TaxID=2213162 RepID=A0A7W3WI62_9ACTN|nr:ketoacyl-ACP synthase III family protein [Streptomyces alkaliterrae]MBB1252315.1 ketoacyl-ACP synthase III family protein [Streptomyces alkaliterrae]
MKFEDVYLSSLGTFVPGLVTTEQAVGSGWYDADTRTASGLESVAVADSLSAPEMAVLAAGEALRRSHHEPGDFGALFHSSAYHQGPDGWSPAHYVLRNTLDTPITAMEVKQGCQGMLSSLVFAAHRLVCDTRKSAVLLTAADNYSAPLVDRWTTSRLSVFGDGAAAAVVSRGGGIARLLSVGTHSAPAMESLHRGSEPIFPPAVTVGRPLDYEERVKFWMDEWAKGNTPPMAHPGEVLQAALDEALEDAGITAADIKRVCHPSATLDALRDQFLDPIGFSLDKGIWEHTSKVGHISAADVFIGLEHLWSTRKVGPGDKVLLFTGSPGFEAGVAIVEIVAEPDA